MEVMSAKDAAEKWGVSQRRVAMLCAENRIDNATMVGNMWIIPRDAQKPIDARSIRHNASDKTVKPFLKWAGVATDGSLSVKVLGPGCASCHVLLENTKEALKNKELAVEVDYVTDMQKIMEYGVMSVPALVVNERVVSMGKALKAAEVEKLLTKLGF